MIAGLVLSAVKLTPAPCWGDDPPALLTVDSVPAGAKVYVNGYFKGQTPARIPIYSAGGTARLYRTTVVLAGCAKWDRQVELVAGRETRVSAELERLVGAVICIDPGHPSETSDGTRGPSGVTENHINWVVALKLREALQQQGYQVVLTKSGESERVTNRRRAEIANAAGAAVMLRLHCDSAPASGMAVYYPDRQGTKYGVTGPPASVIEGSRHFAKGFYPAATAALSGSLKGRGIHGDSGTYIGGKQGALTGSIFAEVPTLTVEMCVLTNRSDERFIASEEGQALMVRALATGIAAGLAELN